MENCVVAVDLIINTAYKCKILNFFVKAREVDTQNFTYTYLTDSWQIAVVCLH